MNVLQCDLISERYDIHIKKSVISAHCRSLKVIDLTFQ